jgi:hypothetical protein
MDEAINDGIPIIIFAEQSRDVYAVFIPVLKVSEITAP